MKGTLFVLLALLVTSELGIEMAEACPLFYGIFATVPLGNKLLLDTSLKLVHATPAEEAAIEKIQDCFNEAGLRGKAFNVIVMGMIATSKDCIQYSVEMLKDIQKLTTLIPSANRHN